MRSVNKTASAENGLRLLWIRKEIQVSIRQPAATIECLRVKYSPLPVGDMNSPS